MARILLTGSRAPVTLELARSFHQQGHIVFTADSLRFPLARWSRSIKRFYHIPAPAHDFKGFQKKLLEIVVQEKIEHLIPTCEETFYVAQCPELRLHCTVWTSEIALLNTLHNKYTFAQLAQKYFEVPATTRCDEWHAWSQSTEMVFKPIYSRFAASVLIKPSQKNIQLNKLKKNPTEWIAQKFVQGQELSVFSLWENGRLKAYTSYYSQYRIGKGAGIFFQAHWNQATYDAVYKLGQELAFHGMLCLDLIVSDNKVYVLECNPRATSGLHLMADSIAYDFLHPTQTICRQSSFHGLKTVLLFSKPWIVFLPQWYKSSDVVFSWKDPLPFLGQSVSILELVYKKIFSKKTLLQITTEDIEWNGAHD
jgi:hypothetical protein